MVAGTAPSSQPSLTADGQLVAFVTKATNLQVVKASGGGEATDGDLLVDDDQRVLDALHYLSGQALIPRDELRYYLRRAPALALVNRLGLARFPLPDVVVLLELDGAAAMARFIVEDVLPTCERGGLRLVTATIDNDGETGWDTSIASGADGLGVGKGIDGDALR